MKFDIIFFLLPEINDDRLNNEETKKGNVPSTIVGIRYAYTHDII